MVHTYRCHDCKKEFQYPQSLRKHNFKFHEDKVHLARQRLAQKRKIECQLCGNSFLNKASLRSHKTRCLVGKKYNEILKINHHDSIEDQVLSKDSSIESLSLNAPGSDEEQSAEMDIDPREEFKQGGPPPHTKLAMTSHQGGHKQPAPQVSKEFLTTSKDMYIDILNASTDISHNPSKSSKCSIQTETQVEDQSKYIPNYSRAQHLGVGRRTCLIKHTPKKNHGSIQIVSDVDLQIAKFIDDDLAHSNAGGPANNDRLSSISRISDDHVNLSNQTITDIAALVVKDQSNQEPPQACDRDTRISKFRNYMYTFIYNRSNLDWSYQEIVPRDSQRNPQYMTRSQAKVAPDNQLDGTDSQVSYGEATQGSIQQLVKVLGEVGFTSTSSFIDIGSGYGKAVIDVALSTPMSSYGIECSNRRAGLSQKFLAELQSSYVNDNDIQACLNRIQFMHLNLRNLESLAAPGGAPITHLYTFNIRFSHKDNLTLAKLINKSKHLQVFAWCKDQKTTLHHLKVKAFNFHYKFPMVIQGSGESHMLYIYKSTRLGEANQQINVNDDLPQSSKIITNDVDDQLQVDPPNALAFHEQLDQASNTDNINNNQLSLDEDLAIMQEFNLNDQERANYLTLRNNVSAATARKILEKKQGLDLKKQQTQATIHLESALNRVQRFNKFFGIVKVALANRNKIKIEDIYRQDATIRRDLLEEVPLPKFIEEIEPLASLSPGWVEVKILHDGSKWIVSQKKSEADNVRRAIANLLGQAPSTTRGVEVQSLPVPQSKDEQVNIANILNQLELDYQIYNGVAGSWSKVSDMLDGVVLVEESDSEVELTQSDQNHIDQLKKMNKNVKTQQGHEAMIKQSYLKMKREMKVVEKQKRKNQQMAKTLAQMQNNYYIHQSQTAILANQHHLDMLTKLYGEKFNIKVEKTLPSDFFSMRYLCTRLNPGPSSNPQQSRECIFKVSHRPSDGLYQTYTYARNMVDFINRNRLFDATTPDISMFEDRIYEVYPYRGTDLASFAERIKRNVDQQSKAIVNLIQKMNSLHHTKVTHGSLSDRCISFSGDCEVNIDSWGYPLNVDHHDSVFQLAKNFAAPEQFYSNSKTQAVDCFSVGVICFYIIHRRQPYSRDEMQLWNIGKPCGSNRIAECDEPLCKRTMGFLRKLLKRDPKNRWQLQQVVQEQQFLTLVEQNKNQIRSLQP